MKYNSKGFTVIELLVVIAITSVLTLIVFVNVAQNKYLENSSNEVISNLELAQTMAKTGQKCCAIPGIRDDEVPDNYFLEFALNQDEYSFQATMGAGGPDDVFDQEYQLGENVIFSDCRDMLDVQYDPCMIFFAVPDGQLYTNSVLAIDGMKITLMDTDSGEERNIILNAMTGLISE